ncbi:hypothetical protein ACQEVG_04395 [Streptomyces sp. CA-135486]|uniref:hypothetical protein n=1 Tax=Streptomyces sp. CA-135486 TaxID=3240049 RepID=UPI003D94A1A9
MARLGRLAPLALLICRAGLARATGLVRLASPVCLVKLVRVARLGRLAPLVLLVRLTVLVGPVRPARLAGPGVDRLRPGRLPRPLLPTVLRQSRIAQLSRPVPLVRLVRLAPPIPLLRLLRLAPPVYLARLLRLARLASARPVRLPRPRRPARPDRRV